MAYLNEINEMDTDDYRGFLLRGVILASRRKYHEAIKDFTHAIKLNPDNPDGWHNRGIAYKDLGMLDHAHKDILKYEKMKP